MKKYFWVVVMAINLINVILAIEKGRFMSPNYVYDLRNGQKIYDYFIAKYNRTFNGELDYQNRYSNFIRTLKKINQVNSITDSVKVGPNQFADYSTAEYRAAMKKLGKDDDPELAITRERNTPDVKSLFKVARSNW